MRIINPGYEMAPFDAVEMIQALELAGRTCYKSEKKVTANSAEAFVRSLLKSGHESVLEHRSITVKFTIDRGTSHCLVRHRIASYSQESTQYCNYSKDRFDGQITFIKPPWCYSIPPGEYDSMVQLQSVGVKAGTADIIWAEAMLDAELGYMYLIKAGWKPQQARTVPPASVKTELVMTCNLRMWRHIFLQRITTIADQAQTRQVLTPLCKELQFRLPSVFGDIHPLGWNHEGLYGKI